MLGMFSLARCTDYLLRISFDYAYNGRDVRFLPAAVHCGIIRDPAPVKIMSCYPLSIRKVVCCFIQAVVNIVAFDAPHSTASEQRGILFTVGPNGHVGGWTD